MDDMGANIIIIMYSVTVLYSIWVHRRLTDELVRLRIKIIELEKQLEIAAMMSRQSDQLLDIQTEYHVNGPTG